jgi:glucosamine kinase
MRSLASEPSTVIAIDGGGTATRARVYTTRGVALGEGRAGPSGLSLGVEQAWSQIELALKQALQRAGLTGAPIEQMSLAAALAGAGNEARVRDFIAYGSAYYEVQVHSDVLAAHSGAFDGGPGVVLVAGTGSVALRRSRDGSMRRAGGWGFPEGDEGSGAWLGLQAVNETERALDGRAPIGRLVEEVGKALGRQIGADSGLVNMAATVRQWRQQSNQTSYAALAPLVFETEDQDHAAAALLDRAAAELRSLVLAVDPHEQLDVVLVGSVGSRLLAARPTIFVGRIASPVGDALSGAFRLWRVTAMQRGPSS